MRIFLNLSRLDKVICAIIMFSMNKFENKIFNQDCIIGMKQLPNDYADIIIADPPYNIGKDFGNNSDKQKKNDYIEYTNNSY